MARRKPSRLKVLQVVHAFPPEGRGGTESYVFEATSALRQAGLDARVLAGSMEPRSPAVLVEGEHEGVPVIRLHREGLFLDNWEKSYDPAAAALFDSVLAASRPDVVHVHHWIRLSRNLVEIAAARGIPAVVTLHDATASCPRVFRVRDETLCHRPLSVESCHACVPRPGWMSDAECAEEIDAYRDDYARELDLAAAVIVPSAAHRDFLSRELGRPAEAFRVVPHGRLERDRPERLPHRERKGPIRLGFWGQLASYKGYHLLLDALKRLPPEVRDRFEVVCSGTASDPDYRRRLDWLSSGIAVTEHGAFTPRDLTASAIDLAVLPSIASESFSFVLDEAFELGVPALVPDRGALAERLGGAGATFEAESPEALAALLRKIAADPGMIDAWRERFPELTPMAVHAVALAALYEEVGGARRRKTAPDPAVATARLARLARRVEARTQELDRASALAADRAGQLARKEEDLAGFERSIALHEQERDTEKAELAAASSRLEQETSTRDRLISDLRKAIAEHQAEIVRRETELGGFQRSSAELRAEVSRLDREVRAQVAARASAEGQWTATLAEHRQALDRHAAALAAGQKRGALLEAAVNESRAKVEEALAQARSLAAELTVVQTTAAAAADARAAAERDAALLDAARSEEQGEIASWRDRTFRAEAAIESIRGAYDATAASVGAVRQELQEVRGRLQGLEDDGRRIAEMQARAAAALALTPREDGDRVAAAADLAGAVTEQQGRIDELRAWLRASNGTASGAEVLERLDALPRRLRVLLVIHDFLPYHAAGSEVYTYQLAKALQARSDVEILFAENRPGRPQYEARRDEWDGIPVTEVVHHGAWPDFRSTYEDPRMEARFDEVLDRFRPDVVHVQHTKFFGVGILRRAARRGIPVVYTLHEYMLLCGRDGQLLQANLERCQQPEVGKCAECLAPTLAESGLASRAVQALGRGLARALPGKLKELGTRIERRAAVRYVTPAGPARRRELVAGRERAIRGALEHVDLFLAPSEFLRKTFVDSGFVRPDRIVVSRYGQDLSRFKALPRTPSANLRVGFLGTIAAYKGVEVLVDALNRLEGHPVEGRIHGVTEFFPDFVAALRKRITNPKVRLLGRYENKDVGRILSEMDVLVVPSLWWENSPITIHEAFLAGVPVIASNQGGMAELVQHGKNGALFQIGEPADLARVLLRFVADRSLAAALRPRRESIRDIREDALWTEGQYRRLIAAKAPR
jgi:glycosyltransferase involved in cell wall biosynthesis